MWYLGRCLVWESHGFGKVYIKHKRVEETLHYSSSVMLDAFVSYASIMWTTLVKRLPYKAILINVFLLLLLGISLRSGNFPRRPIPCFRRRRPTHSPVGLIRWKHDQRAARAHRHRVQPRFQCGWDATGFGGSGQ